MSPSEVVGELALANANAPTRFRLAAEAIDAWRLQLDPLKNGITELLAVQPVLGHSTILLEYPIPVVGKRIDAVLLVAGIVIVIETKTGFSPSSAVRQVEDYALNLACFHEVCANRKIVPVVIGNALAAGSAGGTTFDDLMEHTRVVTPDRVGEVLKTIVADEWLSAPIDACEFDRGRFKPIPRIIDAAVSLYHDMDVFEIGHACAAEESLQRTTDALIRSVQHAKNNHEKVICFVTGVPGTGKTLVGLNAVHQPEIRNIGSFLSGNGPLVKIIQEALIRDIVARSRKTPNPITRADAALRVHAFVYNVHRFADQFIGSDQCPIQKVVVFDEAQRAWDRDQNERAKRPAVSEPEMMLEVMDRHADWAVILALVGGGQEINRGEAGLAEWGRALQSCAHWHVMASPEVLKGGDSVAGFRLFENAGQKSVHVQPDEDLHLTVATRSIRAKQISAWVNAVLEGRQTDAQQAAEGMQARPIVSRDLTQTRRWLRSARRGFTRSGLVASSSASRLRADGIETAFDFHQRFDWDHWFLDNWDCEAPDCDHQYCNDVRSSSTLEVAGTQFEVQGLELDWVGVCWGDDLVWSGSAWQSMTFTNKRWKPVTDQRKADYLINGYRVLLTRARQRMIIYVPQASYDDTTRLGKNLDETAQWLLQCGAQPSGTT